jgi:hypothetical protein
MMPMTLASFLPSPAKTSAPSVAADEDVYEVDSRLFTPEDMDEHTRWLAETAVDALRA